MPELDPEIEAELTGLMCEPGDIVTGYVISRPDAEHLLLKLQTERDLARLHDAQPYPTADAYDKVCATLHAERERYRNLLAACRVLDNSLDYDGTTIARQPPMTQILTLGTILGAVKAVSKALAEFDKVVAPDPSAP